MKSSIIQALALEIGEIFIEANDIDEDEMVSPEPNASPEKERKIATEIRQVFEGVESDNEDGDAEDNDEDSEDWDAGSGDAEGGDA